MFGTVTMPGVTLLVLIAGMAVVALADIKWMKVDPWSTGALGAAVAISLLVDGINPTQWIFGLAAAAVAFVFYLELGVRGYVGGGDIKLAPIPALVLGVINPLLAIWGVCVAIALQAAIRRFARPAEVGDTEEKPHVPAMFYATVISAVVGTALFGS